MRLRNTLFFTLTFLLASSTVALCAKTPVVKKFLPDSGDVKGVDVLKNSYIYGKGDDISKIYNGGYEYYTDNGIVDAARQMYESGGKYYEITVHTVETEKKAVSFLVKERNEKDGSNIKMTGGKRYFTVSDPGSGYYATCDKYYLSVIAFGSSDKEAQTVNKLASEVISRIKKHVEK